MANYAVVVGISQYNDPGIRPLSTPVDDALRMAAWLVDSNGGNVPLANLLLLLSPIPTAAPAGVTLDLARLEQLGNVSLATRDNVLRAPLNVDGQATQGGERVFVYYAGHGLQARSTFSNEDAIVPADYEDGVRNALNVSSLLRFFQATAFPEQFFFFDCCRDLALNETDLDRFKPKIPDPTRPAPDQFAFNATAPGLRALDGRGMLTDLLLDGLTGAGASKYWDAADQRYKVRTLRLFDYIVQKFKSLPQPPVVGNAGGTLQIQRPRLGGEHTEDPVLVDLPEAAIPAVPFDVALSPQQAWPVADITLQGDGIALDRRGIANSPVSFSVKPRTLAVTVTAPNWIPSSRTWMLDVYEQMELPVQLVQQAAAPVRGISPHPPSPPDANAAPATESPAQPGRVIVTAPDSLAPLELLDANGSSVIGKDGETIGFGDVGFRNLKPGIYRARLRMPGGQVVEHTFRLEADRGIEIRFQQGPALATSGLLKRTIEHAGFAVGDDQLVQVSERVEPIVAPALSTILALASDATTESAAWGGHGQRLRKLGLHPLTKHTLGSRSGGASFEVLLAAESAGPKQVAAFLKGLEVQIWSFDAAPPAPAHPERSDVAGVAACTQAVKPGPLWFAIRSAAGQNATFATAALQGRATQFILHQTSEGRIEIYQFLPGPQASNEIDTRLLRQLDLAERFLIDSQLAPAFAALDPLLKVQVPDPIAGCLGGHLLWRQRKLEQLSELAEKMLHGYPELPDAHVLDALRRTAADDAKGARAASRRALDCGLPLVAPLLEGLAHCVAQAKVKHPRASLLQKVGERIVPGLLWTAWRPEPGELPTA